MDNLSNGDKRSELRGSLVLISLGLLSVGLLSARTVWSGRRGRAPADTGLRYLCVGSIAVRLGPPERDDEREAHLLVPSAEARKKCRPPLPPRPEGSEILVAAVAPVSGYGVALEYLDAPSDDALRVTQAMLEGAGWSETAGSRLLNERRADLAAAAYLKEGAWIVTLAVPWPKRSGTLMLSAGVWPGLKERSR